jgi:hypothetical protein
LPAQAAAADPQASVPPTRYQSALDYRPPAPSAASPDRNWVASNQTVAATNSMALTMKPLMKPMSGHAGRGAAEGGQDQAADPHAGHAMPAASSTDPHAGHAMPPATAIGMHTGQAQHDHAAMQGMSMTSQASPAMCMSASAGGAEGMQCKAGPGKMSCCENCPCMDKMKKNKETP